MGTIYASPDFCDEMQPLLVASGLVPAHGVEDEGEILEVKQLSVEKLERATANRAFVDAKSIAVYPRAELQGGTRRDVSLDPQYPLLDCG